MVYKINAQHYANVSKLQASKRYEYFIKRVAGWEQAWTLESDRGWRSGSDDSGVIHVPLWAHPLFAEMCLLGEWSDTKIVALDLDDLLDNILPQLESEQHRVSVMPLPDGRSVSVEPKRLRDDLLIELENY